MIITISESQYNRIIEAYQKKTDPIAEHIRRCLKDVYSKIPGKWGVAPNPDGNCKTSEGVINVYEHEPGIDSWSILNRFDTNSLVRKKIIEWYKLESGGREPSPDDLMDWIEENKEKLFNGEHTEELVQLNKSTIDKGNKNEEFAKNILRDFYGESSQIDRFCSGDIRDTRFGQDIAVTANGTKYYIQVKPFQKILSFVDKDGDTFYEVHSKNFSPSKYSERKVQVFLFVDEVNGNYMAFQNKRNKILTRGSATSFYEPFLISNMTLPTKMKRTLRPELGDELFKMGERRLQNLEFRKSEIEKLIALEKEKLKKSTGEI